MYICNIKNPIRRSFNLVTALIACVLFPVFSFAQITVTPGSTAFGLASALSGSGVIILAPVLTCNTAANGTFTTGATDPVGVSTGITLMSGEVSLMAAAASVGPESSFFTPSLSDAELATLAGGTTNDACVLEFDFKAAGDTIKFDYVFASEEYPEFACSGFNDVFGFLISGGVTAAATTYATPYNIARVPGTNIPVCINSVNSAPTGTPYAIAGCSSLGPGSPFGMYYVDNAASTFLVFDGKTTVLQAVAAVSPCDTYHLKLGIADVGDNAYNSAVFIKGGSLTSTTTTLVSATGTSGLPYCIRGCGPGNFVFTIPTRRTSPFVVHYNILGTAVNGYDYTTIPDSVIIPVTDTFAILNINTTLVPPAGPKVVTLEILNEDPCHPGVFTPGGTASLTILDSFNFRILTPDTSICAGQYVHLVAVGDTVFDDILNYTWTPSTTISDDTLLITDATPVVTTTYTLTATAPAVLGCIPQTKAVTISIYPNPVITVDSHLVKTCLGVPVAMNVYTTPPPGVGYTYNWSPGLGLSSTSTPSTIVTPTLLGDITYTVTVYPTLLAACASEETITVHTLPNDFVLNNNDTAICIGDFVQTSISGSAEFNWRWRPPTGVSDTTIMEPVITPTVSGGYTVTASYAHCPDMVHDFYIEVDHPAPLVLVKDTICIPMTYTIDLTVPGSTGFGEGYYSYQWTPATYVSNDTIPNPIITPTLPGAYSYTVTVQPHAVSCAVNDVIDLYVLPNTINIVTPDTAICRGMPVQVIANGNSLFNYQWLPTAGIAISNVVSPFITPDTSAWYKVGVSFHLCPTFYDSIRIDVQPVPEVHVGNNRFVCEADTIRLTANVIPGWYNSYSYSWAPAANLNSSTDRSVILTGVDTGMVVVTVTTPAGCKGADSVDIVVLPANFAAIEPEMNFCPHDSAVLVPTGGVYYHWTPAMYLSSEKAAQPVIKPITDQSYTIVATNNYGCRDTIYFDAKVYPGAVFNLTDSVRLFPGESYQIDPQTNCTQFSWTPSGGLSGKFIANPLATPEVSTWYVVSGVTEHGCKTKDSIMIFVDEGAIVGVPNAFAPGHGVNNEFKIIKRGIATLNYFRIFNRWGNLIFETTDAEKGWNGEYNGIPQPIGVYVYEVEVVAKSGKTIRKQGNVTLLR
jgi:gliding motility-associated-like protein